MAEPEIKAKLVLVTGGGISGGGGSGSNQNRVIGLESLKANRAISRFLPVMARGLSPIGLATALSVGLGLVVGKLSDELGKSPEVSEVIEEKEAIDTAKDVVEVGKEQIEATKQIVGGMVDYINASGDLEEEAKALSKTTGGLSGMWGTLTRISKDLGEDMPTPFNAFFKLLTPFVGNIEFASDKAAEFANVLVDAMNTINQGRTAGSIVREARILSSETGVSEIEAIRTLSQQEMINNSQRLSGDTT